MQDLNRALTEIDVMLPPKQYIKNIIQVTCDKLDYLFVTVIEVSENGEAHMVTSYNLPENYPEMVNNVEASILSGPAGEAFETGEILVVQDPFSDPRLDPWKGMEVITGPIETIIWAPLLRGGKVFGICAYHSDNKKELSEHDLSTLEQIGVMISIAITGNQYLDKLTKKTDELENEIIERKNAENQLQQLSDELEMKVEERTSELSEANKKLQLFRNQIDQSNDAIFVTDPQTAIILDVNKESCRSLGYTRDELIGMKVMDIETNFPDVNSWKNYINTIKNVEHIVLDEGMNVRKDGATFQVEVSERFVTHGDNKYLVSVVRDVTKRKQAEKTLNLNEARLAALFKVNQMKDATINEIADFVLEEGIKLTESKIGYLCVVNEDESIQTTLSYSKNVMKQCNLNDQIEFITKDLGLGAECFRQRKAVIINDYSAFHPNKKGYSDNHLPLFKYLSIPLFYKGKIVATMAVANKEDDYNDSDVQQLTLLMNGMWEHIKRTEYENKLSDTKNYFNMIVSMSYDGIFVSDSKGKCEFINDAGCEITGYTKKEMINKPFIELIPPEYVDFMMNKWHAIEEGECGIYEAIIVKKDGARNNLLISHSDVEINGDKKYIAIAKDMTTDVTEYIKIVAETLKDHED